MTALRLSSNDPKIGALPLEGATIAIGRHADNDIALDGDTVASRFHCVIELAEDGRFVIKDLGSRNGTRLNGQPVINSPLTAGDVITIGKHTFSVEVDEDRMKAAERLSAVGTAGAQPLGSTPWAAEIRRMIDALPPKGTPLPLITLHDSNDNPSDAFRSSADGPVCLRLLILLANKARSTDIHIEPRADDMQVRMRVDGQMVSIINLPRQVGELTLGVVRTACQMLQAARDEVQEGHCSIRFPDRRSDYRASLTPTMHGPKLVLRILDSMTAPQSLGEMSLPLYMLDRLRHGCEKDAGMILAAGPTGSGKTTTLYNAIREIDRSRRNVVTIEDPVEYSIEGVTQIPVGHANSFGTLLRSILRQDPDVILVGEIRDQETARTAMQAAMTGHLVFSTIHAKDTIGSVFRLLDLGLEPYLVANSMDIVVAQRLVRLLCDSCKRPVKVSPGQMTRLGRFLEGKNEVFAATGCARCLRTGFHGRRAIYELLDFNEELRDCVLNQPSISKMRKIIEQGVFTTLQQSGWLLVARGVTTLDEIDRVTGT